MNQSTDLTTPTPEQVVAEAKLNLSIRDLVREMGKNDKIEITRGGDGKVAITVIRSERMTIDFS